MPIWDPIESFNEWLKGLADELAKIGFEWMTDFVLTPTNFSKISYATTLQEWIIKISIVLGGLFLTFNLIKVLVSNAGNFGKRSASEVVTKSIIGTVLAILSPWIIPKCLLPINNAWVEFIRYKGVSIEGAKELLVLPTDTAGLIIILFLILAVLWVWAGFQNIIRLGDLGALTIAAPFVFITMQNEDTNMAPVWWRETVATVFQQSFQVSILWVVLNILGNGKSAEEYLFAIGLMVCLIRSPKFMRNLLYSTGSGSAIIGAAGGTGKMAIYRYAMNKSMGKG
jgi:hypothetical protein